MKRFHALAVLAGLGCFVAASAPAHAATTAQFGQRCKAAWTGIANSPAFRAYQPRCVAAARAVVEGWFGHPVGLVMHRLFFEQLGPVTYKRGDICSGAGDAAQAADMGRLVDDLLFLARSEADDMRYEMARLDPAAVVAEAIDGVSALVERRAIDVRFADGAAARPIVGDAKRLKQALMIVLDNAVKYSKRQGRIDVGIVQDKAGAVIAIRDQGGGIPADELPRVFDRFFRGETARAETSGSGLGLTIARRIVEKHGGAIEVASVEGQGTIVHITLPERELAA